jgi:hydroxymethylpyrimidine/phosphomethylpyrimidine kinase
MEAGNPEQMKLAAQRLHEMGSKAVVVTGGHLDCAIDLLSVSGEQVRIFRADRVNSTNTHGTGCAFSTALACQLALGQSLPVAVLLAKAYVLTAIKSSYAIGRGHGPINHTYRLSNR